MQFKQTKKLFYGKYQYKIVLVFSGAHLFRNAPSDVIADRIKNVKLETDVYARKRWTIKTEEELVEMLEANESMIKEKVGASMLKISVNDPAKNHTHSAEEKVKGKTFSIYFDKV